MATTYFRKVKPSNIKALDQDFSSYSTASTYSGNELIPMNQNGSTVYTDLSSIANFVGGGSIQQALTNYKMTTATLTGDGTVKTIQDSNITSDMVVIEASLSNPAAQANDITITTSNGSFTIGPANALVSGASTTITLTFGVAYSTAPDIATNLASESTANLLQQNPRPGVIGVLGLSNGGTGINASSSDDLKNKIGISPLQSGLGIIVDGNKTTHTGGVSTGQYVFVRNSTISGITDGFYKATQAIPADTAITSAYLAAVDGGVLNELYGKTLNYSVRILTQVEPTTKTEYNVSNFSQSKMITITRSWYSTYNGSATIPVAAFRSGIPVRVQYGTDDDWVECVYVSDTKIAITVKRDHVRCSVFASQ